MEYLKDLGLGSIAWETFSLSFTLFYSLQVYLTGRLGDAKPSRSP